MTPTPVPALDDLQLVLIEEKGTPAAEDLVLDDLACSVCAQMAYLYAGGGFFPPWVGYLAISGGTVVGSCAFKAPPSRGEVEIAYYTFPPNEGRGVATSMARRLLSLAETVAPDIEVTAQTLPERSASTRILEKLGFERRGTIIHPEDGEVWEWVHRSPAPAATLRRAT